MKLTRMLIFLMLLTFFCGQALAGKMVVSPGSDQRIKSSYSFVTEVIRSGGKVIIFVDETWDKASLSLKNRFSADLRDLYPSKSVIVKSTKTNEVLLEVTP